MCRTEANALNESDMSKGTSCDLRMKRSGQTKMNGQKAGGKDKAKDDGERREKTEKNDFERKKNKRQNWKAMNKAHK